MSTTPPFSPEAALDEGRAVSFISGIHRIDARVHEPRAPQRGAIVVAHPHPAHGGRMDHPVVVAAASRAAAHGLLALRFDFRGVGYSEGDVADIEGHFDDWRAAEVDLLRRAGAGTPLFAAGFSYGARTLSWVLHKDPPGAHAFRGALLMAPATRVPQSKREFGNLLLGRPIEAARRDAEVLRNLEQFPIPAHIVVGSEDVVAPVDELEGHRAPDMALHVLPGLSHFFSQRPGAGPVDYGQFIPALDRALADLVGRFGARPSS